MENMMTDFTKAVAAKNRPIILIQFAWAEDENGDIKHLILERQELQTFFQCCEELDIRYSTVSTQEILTGAVRFPVSCTYLWGSCALQKVSPYPLSSIAWNLYSPLVLHHCCDGDDNLTYLQNEHLNDILFSPFIEINDSAKLLNAEDATGYCAKPLFSDKTFFVKTGTREQINNALRQGYNSKFSCEEYDSKFLAYVGLSEDKTEYLGEEVRNIVLNGKIASSCTYVTSKDKIVQPFQYLENRHTVESVQWQEAQSLLDRCPNLVSYFNTANQPYFVMDTIFDKWDSKWKILELNAFWSSGLYGGNPKPIFEYLVACHQNPQKAAFSFGTPLPTMFEYIDD